MANISDALRWKVYARYLQGKQWIVCTITSPVLYPISLPPHVVTYVFMEHIIPHSAGGAWKIRICCILSLYLLPGGHRLS